MRTSAPVRRMAAALCGLVLTLGLAGCGGTARPTAAGDSSTGLEGGSSSPIVLDVTIDNLQVSPTIGRVPVDIGDEIHLSVWSDTDDIVHVHGVERLLPVKANQTEEFDLTVPPGVPRGTYTVETHSTRLVLFELRIR